MNSAFLNAEAAWTVAAGNSGFTVYRTADGGTNWHRATVQVPNNLEFFLSFADPAHGWLLVDKGAAAMHEAVDIYQTADGGAHWSVVSSTRATGSTPGALPFAGDKGGITFASTTVGWAALRIPAPGGSVLYRTTDAGKTWSRQPLPASSVAGGLSEAQLPIFFSPTVGVTPVQIWLAEQPAPAQGVFDWLDARRALISA